MSYEERVRSKGWARRLNSAIYHYRTHRWRWHPRFRRDDPTLAIDRPIFLLGTQGGGLTLLSRILRRTPGTVSATGDHRYWAGYDEMQDVLFDALPPELRLHPLKPPWGVHADYGTLGWLYASELHFDDLHRGAGDATPELERRFRRLLRGLLRMNGARGAPARLVDKSQSYTIRLGLVAALLRDCRPKFVLVTRDPFAMCWRAVERVGAVRRLERSDEEKLGLAIQHWRNSVRCALREGEGADLASWRFEDFLAEPDRVIREVCAFCELPYDEAILPGPDDRIPVGSMWDAFDRSKWYPIRPPVNRGYLERMPGWARERIARECAEEIERFGYAPPP